MEIVLSIRAILLLVIFLFIVLSCYRVTVQKYVLREELERKDEMLYGIRLTIIGMCIFNVRLTM